MSLSKERYTKRRRRSSQHSFCSVNRNLVTRGVDGVSRKTLFEKNSHATVVTTGKVVNNTRLEEETKSLPAPHTTDDLASQAGGGIHTISSLFLSKKKKTQSTASPVPELLENQHCRERLPVAGFGHLPSLGLETLVTDLTSRIRRSCFSSFLFFFFSLQVDRRRAVADGRPTTGKHIQSSTDSPGRPSQLGCRRTPTHRVAIQALRHRLHRAFDRIFHYKRCRYIRHEYQTCAGKLIKTFHKNIFFDPDLTRIL